MTKHWMYFRYVARHKWYVFLAGLRYGVPLRQLLVHDLSKFRPDEWGPYAEWFYGYDGGSWHVAMKHCEGCRIDSERRQVAFLEAFLRHLHRNPHHWQHWVLTPDAVDRPARAFAMPERYVREMVADWEGAGRAITGRVETATWYATRGPRDKLHPDTRALVEDLLRARFPGVLEASIQAGAGVSPPTQGA